MRRGWPLDHVRQVSNQHMAAGPSSARPTPSCAVDSSWPGEELRGLVLERRAETESGPHSPSRAFSPHHPFVLRPPPPRAPVESAWPRGHRLDKPRTPSAAEAWRDFSPTPESTGPAAQEYVMRAETGIAEGVRDHLGPRGREFPTGDAQRRDDKTRAEVDSLGQFGQAAAQRSTRNQLQAQERAVRSTASFDSQSRVRGRPRRAVLAVWASNLPWW